MNRLALGIVLISRLNQEPLQEERALRETQTIPAGSKNPRYLLMTPGSGRGDLRQANPARNRERPHGGSEDQKEIAIYVKARCRRCWRAKRLLRRRSYAFEVIDVSGDDGLRNWLIEATGSKTVPQVFVDGRLVGGFAVVRALDSSGDLDRLVRGEV